MIRKAACLPDPLRAQGERLMETSPWLAAGSSMTPGEVIGRGRAEGHADAFHQPDERMLLRRAQLILGCFRGCHWCWWAGRFGQVSEELPADVALEVAHVLAFGAAFGGAAGDVGAGAGVVAHADQYDGVEGSAEESVAPRLSRCRVGCLTRP